VLGAVKTFDAGNDLVPERRRTGYLVASRYLTEAHSYGWPASREKQGLLLLGKSLVESFQVRDGIIVLNEVHPLAYNGPRTIQGLYDDKNFVSRLSVGVTTSRVMRTRPMFRQWALESELIVDDGQLDLDQITSIADKAGQMIGLGDYRPRFGRFNVEVTEIKD